MKTKPLLRNYCTVAKTVLATICRTTINFGCNLRRVCFGILQASGCLAAGFVGLLTAAVSAADVRAAAVWAAIVLEAIVAVADEAIVAVADVATAATAACAWLIAVGAVATARAVAGELLGVRRSAWEGHQARQRGR